MSNPLTAGNAALNRTEPEEFDPAETLLGVIRRVVAENRPAIITTNGGSLRVLPAQGEYFTTLAAAELVLLYRRPAIDFKVRRLAEPEAGELLRSGVHGRNLDELLWNAALYAAQGRLMKGCHRDDVVLLKHWPNLTRVHCTPNAMRLAALLTRYPTSVTLASHLLKVPAEEVNDFYSAACAAGWAVAVNRKPQHSGRRVEAQGLTPHHNRSLLSQILARVMGM